MVARQKYTQANRRLAISTPLGEDVLLLRALNGSDGISRLFHFNLDLSSEDDSLNFSDLVGQRVTAKIVLADGTDRHWNGFVSRFSQGGRDMNLTSYHAEMVPWLWFLTRTTDCRIFQHKKVPDILKQIFQDLNFQDFEFRLYSDYVERDYCVQYRETDFHFVSRLMEEEGIYYFFEHDQEKHKLIIADDTSAHKPCPGQPTARCEESAGGWQDDDVIREWRQEQELRPGSWAQTDYNFETPSTDLMVSVAGANPYEIYDFPGEYRNRGEGDALAKIRLQQETAPELIGRGISECRAFIPGFTFKLEEHYRSDLNAEYLLTSVHHRATQGGDYSSESFESSDREFSYENRFECIPATVQFRPSRVTPRPTVYGCQTAVVVGPSGEEIYTDKYGRVKVQFHWDREGKRNENSSCWIRVSHPWAGQGWGAVSIPRIGQEVVVDFIEGNPDDPIIVGRVYNAESMPPYGLPGGGMISGFKSNSTKGGGGYNEISANDTKGKEQVTIHAQYDMGTTVQHDQTTTVNNCQSETIAVDKSSNVGSNKTIQVGSNHTETIGGSKTLSVTGSHTESIGSSMSQTVGTFSAETIAAAKALTIGAAYQVTVGAAMNETIGALKAEEIGGAKVVMVGGLSTEKVAGKKSITAGGGITSNTPANISEKAGANIGMVAGSKLTASAGGPMGLSCKSNFTAKGNSKGIIDMGSQLVLKCGGASIILKSGGDIIIKGTGISVKGSTVKIKGSGEVGIKGNPVKEN